MSALTAKAGADGRSSGELRAPGTANAMHRRDSINDDEDNETSGWELDDLQDETYELIPAGDSANANGSSRASLSIDLEKSGKTDINSALAMVKAVVSEDDDPTLPTLTFRVIVLGTILCAIGAAVSQLFFVCYPKPPSRIMLSCLIPVCSLVQVEVRCVHSGALRLADGLASAPSFSGFLIILLSYPAGHWMAQVLPRRYFTLLGQSFTLNPGPFSVKEHVLIAVLAGSGSGAAYGADIIAIMDLYYHQTIGHLGGILLLLSTQMLGFGLSGLMYNLLVRPSKMVWPACLVPISLFNTLHGKESTITWERLRFFRLAFLAIFAWQFIPSGRRDPSFACNMLTWLGSRCSCLDFLRCFVHPFAGIKAGNCQCSRIGLYRLWPLQCIFRLVGSRKYGRVICAMVR